MFVASASPSVQVKMVNGRLKYFIVVPSGIWYWQSRDLAFLDALRCEFRTINVEHSFVDLPTQGPDAGMQRGT